MHGDVWYMQWDNSCKDFFRPKFPSIASKKKKKKKKKKGKEGNVHMTILDYQKRITSISNEMERR